jgi:hypothetical protein
MLGLGSRFYLWALKSRRFDPQTLGYHAPFPNLYTDGRICWGVNTPPLAHHSTADAAWKLFFASPFNGDLAGRKSKAFPLDVRQQLICLAEGKARAYPARDLEPLRPITQLVENALKGG